MAAPREPPSLSRPLVHEAGLKRSLVYVGGAVDTHGDPELSRMLGEALSVRAGEADAGYTHPFHAYPARLHPAVAGALIEGLSARGERVLDPFCGSGTVMVEALARGRVPLGRDLSPLAVELARLKCRKTTVAERKAMQDAVRATIEAASVRMQRGLRAEPPPGEESWFEPTALWELAALRSEIERTRGFVRDAMRMLLSSVLVKVSRQATDTDLTRVEKSFAPGEVFRIFGFKSNELKRCLTALSRAVPQGSLADIAQDDASRLATVPEGSVDAVITSPPYANTYDYADHHARRCAWLGLDDSALRADEIGARRWFADPARGELRFAREILMCCRELARVLRPGGRAAVVIADGAAGTRALRADEALAQAARSAGLRVCATASQPRPSFDRDSLRAFGAHPRREHVLVFVKRPVDEGSSDDRAPG